MTSPIRATVVIPTHDHGPTLAHSVGSALAQTVDELEVFVIGDGVPDLTRDVMADLCHQDKRVRFLDNPKGPRHGEQHRHAALAEARGRIVCYLCDDDLWLSHHVASLEEVLRDAEFGNTLAATIQPEQTFSSHVGDLGLPMLRDHILAGFNFVPLSCAGHLLSAYRQLPYGWRTTPDGIYTDLYMWQQFLGRPQFRFRTSGEITVIHLPSVRRRSWSFEERLAELERWAARLHDDGFQDELLREAATFFREESVRKLVSELQWQQRVGQLEAQAVAVESYVADLEASIADHEAEAAVHAAVSEAWSQTNEALEHACAEWGLTAQRFESLAEDLRRVVAERDQLEAEHDQLVTERDRMRGTLTWRVRNRVIQIPGVGRLAAVRPARWR